MNKVQLLVSLLKESVEKLYCNDSDLLQRTNNMERECVAHVFAYMLSMINNDNRFVLLRSLDIDSEYHTNKGDIKSTEHFPNGTRPDLILHKRLSNENNTLVVEFKPHNRSVANDIRKLQDFTNPNVSPSKLYNYLLGVSVQLNQSGAKYTFVQHGAVVEEKDLQDE